MVADMNKGFTQEELEFIQKQQLPIPADVFLRTLKGAELCETNIS